MQFYVGTSGYSYKEWKGPFYPKNLAAGEMLRVYGEHLPAVEINNTFYSMPRETVLAAWTEQVPPGFRFTLKAPRRITHNNPLRDKHNEVSYLFKTAAILGDQLGAVLFQLPPWLHKNQELLADFIDLLPSGTRAAFEFRHPSWFDEDLYEMLQKKGCALCCSDSDKEELRRFVATADWGYLRLRKPSYSEVELQDWARQITSQRWQTVFAFFKHEEAGAAPKLARRLLDLCR